MNFSINIQIKNKIERLLHGAWAEFTRDKVTTRAKGEEDNNIPISNFHHKNLIRVS